MRVYRTEHPNPQFKRENWVNLNGEWDFGFEKANSVFNFSEDESRAARIQAINTYTRKINVPFCVESTLSGIGHTDFVSLAWYRKKVNIVKNKNRVFLHIGAADYLTTVLVNSKPAGRHKGGYRILLKTLLLCAASRAKKKRATAVTTPEQREYGKRFILNIRLRAI